MSEIEKLEKLIANPKVAKSEKALYKKGLAKLKSKATKLEKEVVADAKQDIKAVKSLEVKPKRKYVKKADKKPKRKYTKVKKVATNYSITVDGKKFNFADAKSKKECQGAIALIKARRQQQKESNKKYATKSVTEIVVDNAETIANKVVEQVKKSHKTPKVIDKQLADIEKAFNNLFDSLEKIMGKTITKAQRSSIMDILNSETKKETKSTKKGKIALKEIKIIWAEGDAKKGDALTKKSYKSWKDVNDDLKYLVEEKAGYNKVKFSVAWADQKDKEDIYIGRLDISPREDNPLQTDNVIGKHIFEIVKWEINNKAKSNLSEDKVTEYKEFLRDYDLGKYDVDLPFAKGGSMAKGGLLRVLKDSGFNHHKGSPKNELKHNRGQYIATLGKDNMGEVVHLDKYTPNTKRFISSTSFDNSKKLADYFNKNQLYATGGSMASGGSVSPDLKNFDLDNLDDFEKMNYDNFSKSMSKEESLQILINNVEGDYTQLSSELSELAEKQKPQSEWDRNMRERDGYAKGGMISVKDTLDEAVRKLTPNQKKIYNRHLERTKKLGDSFTDDSLADYVNGWYGEDIVDRMDFSGVKSFNLGYKVVALDMSQQEDDFWEFDDDYAKGGSMAKGGDIVVYGTKDDVKEMYRDYLNNFLSVEKFAEHYEMSEEKANRIIEIGREHAKKDGYYAKGGSMASGGKVLNLKTEYIKFLKDNKVDVDKLKFRYRKEGTYGDEEIWTHFKGKQGSNSGFVLTRDDFEAFKKTPQNFIYGYDLPTTMAKGGKVYDTNDKKAKAVRKKGNIITFKKKFYPRGTSDTGYTQILVTGFEKQGGSVKIEGKSYDSKWYDSMDSLIKDVDWEKMESWHSYAKGGSMASGGKIPNKKRWVNDLIKIFPKIHKEQAEELYDKNFYAKGGSMASGGEISDETYRKLWYSHIGGQYDTMENVKKDIHKLLKDEKISMKELISETHYAKGGWVQESEKEMEKDGTVGLFSKKAEKKGMKTEQFMKEVLRNPDKYNLKTRREAQWMANVTGDKYAKGGKTKRRTKAEIEIDRFTKNKFKNLSNEQLVDRINKRYKEGKNDDDEVSELRRRRNEQGFKVVAGYDTYSIEYAKGGELQDWKDEIIIDKGNKWSNGLNFLGL